MGHKDDSAKARGSRSGEKRPETGGNSSRGSNKMMAFGPMVTLLIFSTAMLVLPLSTYFYIRHYLINSTTYGAMGAIVMVQLIIAAYIYKAWSDENKEHQEQLNQRVKKK